MVMKFDEPDMRPQGTGEFQLVAVFRDEQTGDSVALNLDQIDSIIGGNLNELHAADLSKGALMEGRNALLVPARKL